MQGSPRNITPVSCPACRRAHRPAAVSLLHVEKINALVSAVYLSLVSARAFLRLIHFLRKIFFLVYTHTQLIRDIAEFRGNWNLFHDLFAKRKNYMMYKNATGASASWYFVWENIISISPHIPPRINIHTYTRPFVSIFHFAFLIIRFSPEATFSLLRTEKIAFAGESQGTATFAKSARIIHPGSLHLRNLIDSSALSLLPSHSPAYRYLRKVAISFPSSPSPSPRLLCNSFPFFTFLPPPDNFFFSFFVFSFDVQVALCGSAPIPTKLHRKRLALCPRRWIDSDREGAGEKGRGKRRRKNGKKRDNSGMTDRAVGIKR